MKPILTVIEHCKLYVVQAMPGRIPLAADLLEWLDTTCPPTLLRTGLYLSWKGTAILLRSSPVIRLKALLFF